MNITELYKLSQQQQKVIHAFNAGKKLEVKVKGSRKWEDHRGIPLLDSSSVAACMSAGHKYRIKKLRVKKEPVKITDKIRINMLRKTKANITYGFCKGWWWWIHPGTPASKKAKTLRGVIDKEIRSLNK